MAELEATKLKRRGRRFKIKDIPAVTELIRPLVPHRPDAGLIQLSLSRNRLIDFQAGNLLYSRYAWFVLSPPRPQKRVQ